MDFPPGTAETVTPLFNVAQASAQTVGVGAFLTLVNNVDMRAYSGYYLHLNAAANVASYVPVRIIVSWLTGATPGATNIVTMEERYEWWAQTASPGANQDAVTNGDIYGQDSRHGSALLMSVFNPGPQPITVWGQVMGTTYPIAYPSWRNGQYDNILLEALSLAVPTTGRLVPMWMSYGPAEVRIDTANFTTGYNIRWGSNNTSWSYLQGLAAGNTNRFTLIAPPRPGLLQISSGGNNAAVSVTVISQRDKQ